MWQVAVGILLLIHGLIHLMGTAVYWRLATIEGLAYPTALLGGRLAAPTAAVQALGGLWLAGALGFGLVVAGLLLGRPWWRPLALGVAALSLVICALGWPDARAGVVINLAIIGLAMGAALVRPVAA
jgi:hypothetical protein